MMFLWAEGLSLADIAKLMRLPSDQTRQRIDHARQLMTSHLHSRAL